MYLKPRATLTFDLLHRSCDTVAIYRSMCLPVFVKIRQTVLGISRWKGLLFLTLAHVTFISDHLTPKVDRFMPLPRGSLVPIGIKIDSFINQSINQSFLVSSKAWYFQNSVFTSLVNECTKTNVRTDKRTDRQVENVMPPSASLACHRPKSWISPLRKVDWWLDFSFGVWPNLTRRLPVASFFFEFMSFKT